jgi:N6-adenosine-specific RNA methylase IME4
VSGSQKGSHIGRPTIYKKGALTAAERQQRHRLKIRRSLPDPKTAAKQQRRAEREGALAAAMMKASQTLGVKLYAVLYVDPPWRQLVWSRETGLDRAADNHYPTMTLDDLAALKLPAAKNCVLFLWATVAQLANAQRLIERWGFEYKSEHAWKKPDLGTGYWVRENLELLLIAVRGNIPAPAPGKQFLCAIEVPRGAPSEKPDLFADVIAQLYPSVPKLEVFARQPRDGWDVWANEVGERDSVLSIIGAEPSP